MSEHNGQLEKAGEHKPALPAPDMPGQAPPGFLMVMLNSMPPWVKALLGIFLGASISIILVMKFANIDQVVSRFANSAASRYESDIERMKTDHSKDVDRLKAEYERRILDLQNACNRPDPKALVNEAYEAGRTSTLLEAIRTDLESIKESVRRRWWWKKPE